MNSAHQKTRSLRTSNADKSAIDRPAGPPSPLGTCTESGQPSFADEIRETPAALRTLLNHWRSEDRQRAADCVAKCRPIREVIFTGMGSSMNAAYPAKYLLARHGIAARIEPASELLYDLLATITPETLVIAVSQSGETIETNKVVAALQTHGPLIVVANDDASRMAVSGRSFFGIHAGRETRTSSKTYTNTIALLYLIAEQIAENREPTSDRHWDALIESTSSLLAQSDSLIAPILSHWTGLQNLQVVARGPSLATAHEFALVLAENTNILVQPVDGGSFRHGFNYMAAEGHHVLFLASEPHTAALATTIAAQVARQGSRVVVLASTPIATHASNPSNRELYVLLSTSVSDLAPIVEIVLLEMLTLRLAEQQGRDPGRLPHKVTQEE